ncbi:MAG: AAA family ATPase [Clostridiales bacterium]|nr:AAA family ATPase [Clostridiales bacterium]MCD8134345.1 AAA family ATPase [Clostridiales bacterium]
MNIQEAKEQIEKAVKIYLAKDPYGNYRIPIARQRPVFLLGAPGIGKTAIMEQIAEEMNLALVSYSMTHHTRQSALGLPFISHKNYGGTEFDVSEYTMSEIIASVYEMMERTGKQEGILFLDEINCVSETLAPSMLQFLQYKTFGKHRVPEGWVVATAGNPPQFNRSVREFDVVTMDRMKLLEVEADYDTWRNYAVNRGIHGSVITYLDIKKNDFYVIENTVDGKSYVTARGWEDLSETIYLYEENDFEVDEILVGQYLRNKRICREFAAYYDLYQKYKKDYRVHQILSGQAGADVYNRAKMAGFDERLSLVGLLLDAIQMEIRDNIQLEDALRKQLLTLKEVKKELEDLKQWDMESCLNILRTKWEFLESRIVCEDEAGSLSEIEKKEFQMVIEALHRDAKAIHMRRVIRPKDVLDLIRERFDGEVAQMKAVRAGIREKLSNLFSFVEKTFGAGNEMLVLVTDLTVNYDSAAFIARCGCEEYEKYNKKFQIYERQQEIEDAVQKLQL